MTFKITMGTKENKVKKIAGKSRIYQILVILIVLTMNLTGCGSDAEDMPDASETSDEIIPAPETYEDYMEHAVESYNKRNWESALAFYQGAKELDGSREEVYRGLSDVYLQMDDVVQALAILDEGIKKCEVDLVGQNMAAQNSLSQRKAYVLAGMVAVGTSGTTNRYDEDGSILFENVWESDENGNKIRNRSVYYGEEGEISYLSENQYDGNGHQIESKYIDYDSDGSAGAFHHKTWAYDVEGNEMEYAEYDESGNIKMRTEYEYDTNGKQIKETNYNENGKVERRVEIAYDAAGKEIKWECYNEYGRLSIQRIYTYDEVGKLIQYDEYFNGHTEKEEYERDENGNVIRSVDYDGEGNITQIYEYEYDELGREIKRIRYEDDGTVGYWRESEYDESGNAIRFQSYNTTGNHEYRISESKYDENGRIIYTSHECNGVVTESQENVYGEDGSIIRERRTCYDSDTGQKTYEKTCEYIYDEKGNMIKYDLTNYEEQKTKNLRWEREYDEAGRGTDFYLYDNEKTASYQGKTEYDENGRMINYIGYDKNRNVLVRRETEYDTSGNVIRVNDYDADGNLIRYYENEYDDFGSVTRRTMYEDDVLKSEKKISYAYHYIGNIDAEAADYMDNDMTPEECNRKQREIFTRFLNGEEKVRYYRDEDNVQNGKIIEETITDFLDSKSALEYTFLDMTGDGIEELIIFCKGDPERLCVIQCSYGVLKVIHNIDGRFDAYLVKWNGRTGIYRDYGIQNGEDRNYYYFLDGIGKKEIFIDDRERFDESSDNFEHFYYMNNNDCFEECDITKGEYYDIVSSMATRMNIDWQKLEESNDGND